MTRYYCTSITLREQTSFSSNKIPVHEPALHWNVNLCAKLIFSLNLILNNKDACHQGTHCWNSPSFTNYSKVMPFVYSFFVLARIWRIRLPLPKRFRPPGRKWALQFVQLCLRPLLQQRWRNEWTALVQMYTKLPSNNNDLETVLRGLSDTDLKVIRF